MQLELFQKSLTATSCEFAEQKLKESQKNLEVSKKNFMAEIDPGELLTFLGILAQETHLTIDRAVPGRLCSKNYLQELPMTISVTGNCEDLLVFCSALEKSPVPFLLAGLKVIVENPQGNDLDNSSRKLQATLDLLCVCCSQ